MREAVEDPLFGEQSRHEVEVGFVVLHDQFVCDVFAAVLRLERDSMLRQNVGDDIDRRHFRKQALAIAAREFGQCRHQLDAVVAGLAMHRAGAGAIDEAVEKAPQAPGLIDANRHPHAQQTIEIEACRPADVEHVTVRRGQRVRRVHRGQREAYSPTGRDADPRGNSLLHDTLLGRATNRPGERCCCATSVGEARRLVKPRGAGAETVLSSSIDGPRGSLIAAVGRHQQAMNDAGPSTDRS